MKDPLPEEQKNEEISDEEIEEVAGGMGLPSEGEGGTTLL